MPSSLGGWATYCTIKMLGPLHFSVSARQDAAGGRGGSLQYFTRDCLDPFAKYKVLYKAGDPWTLELIFPSSEVEANFQKQLMRASRID